MHDDKRKESMKITVRRGKPPPRLQFAMLISAYPLYGELPVTPRTKKYLLYFFAQRETAFLALLFRAHPCALYQTYSCKNNAARVSASLIMFSITQYSLGWWASSSIVDQTTAS